MADKWVVSLGDGTWVALSELPIVALMSEEDLENIEELGGEFPTDCKTYPHIHISNLLFDSVGAGTPILTGEENIVVTSENQGYHERIFPYVDDEEKTLEELANSDGWNIPSGYID